MEKPPDIIMQCPKCKKEFPFSAHYCEDCTAMLEPVERQQTSPAAPVESALEPSVRDEARDDAIEDSTIEALRTDIEESLVFTLIFELDRMKKRLANKEAALADLHAEQQNTTGLQYVRETGKVESDISALLKRTAKIESTLDHILRKLKGDVARLDIQIAETDQGGLLTHFSSAGRYRRMLLSQRSLKKELLKAIAAKSFRRKKPDRRLAAISASIGFLIAASLALSLGLLPLTGSKNRSARTSEAPQTTAGIQAKDLYELLDDIRDANTRKDYWLWQSRYTADYLEGRGGKDNIREQWKQVDYLALQYRIEDVRMLPSMTTAIVAWDMELKSLDSGKTTRGTQKFYSEFVREDGRLKIASVRKVEE